jgi:hypothetical protein
MQTEAALAGWMVSKRVAVFAAVLSLACLLGETAYCWRTPVAFFDTMAYAAIAEGAGNRFAAAGAECLAQVPGKRSACAEVTSSQMFQQVAAYPDADFAQFTRFYTIKPLYCALATALHRWLRVGAFTGLRMLSAGSFLLIGAVAWAWLREHLPPALAPVAAAWLMASGNVLGLGKDLLPDALSTALQLLALYLLLYRSAWLGVVVMALALLARPENILLIGCLGVAWVWRTHTQARQRWVLLGGLALGCAAVSFALGRATGELPWAVLFRRSFLEFISPAQFAGTHITLRQYAHVMADNGVRTLLFCLPVAVFLAILAMIGARQASALRALVLASTAAVGLRVLLYPGVEDRYYVWFYLVCAVSAACVMAERAEIAGCNRGTRTHAA